MHFDTVARFELRPTLLVVGLIFFAKLQLARQRERRKEKIRQTANGRKPKCFLKHKEITTRLSIPVTFHFDYFLIIAMLAKEKQKHTFCDWN